MGDDRNKTSVMTLALLDFHCIMF